ncbi:MULTISPECIES: aldose epimerase family protein [Methylobacterium]|uniref:aldose epimerase family protein n=1 Tax=Methylobacterium TaxID=407 RepID=UPI0005B8810C|nr:MULTISPECIES: aldose epimerase family protein [Methylobacterium]KOX50237.1 aldose epimerase [Streptomyces purpurogeneiscleroticus]MDH3032409.1 galactose mutarotase [Methylobacterium fujisawaense]
MRGVGPLALCACAAIPGLTPAPVRAAEPVRTVFGTLPDGRSVEEVTLTNGKGITARILSWGALLRSLDVPDRSGKAADVVLGYNDLASYLTKGSYFGVSVGRYANRIRAGRFTLDGQTYTLATNDGPNALHGGAAGFDKRLWTITAVKGGAAPSVTLRYVSPDGEEGYPGTLTATATYTLDATDTLTVTYEATTDKPTIVNLTNHSFFNLAGEGSGRSILDQTLTIPAERFTPVDATLIPTGAHLPVAGTPFDFRKPTVIGARIRDGRDEQIVRARGYDHNWVVTDAPTAEPHLVARVEDPESGRILEVASNQPGVQFYAGNFLNATVVGKSGLAYRQSDALALEPELFPDTPNQPAFGSARLDPGKTYRNVIAYRFSTSPAHRTQK